MTGLRETRLSLTTGPDRPLWQRLADRLPGASEIDLLASFVQMSGLDLIGTILFPTCELAAAFNDCRQLASPLSAEVVGRSVVTPADHAALPIAHNSDL